MPPSGCAASVSSMRRVLRTSWRSSVDAVFTSVSSGTRPQLSAAMSSQCLRTAASSSDASSTSVVRCRASAGASARRRAVAGLGFASPGMIIALAPALELAPASELGRGRLAGLVLAQPAPGLRCERTSSPTGAALKPPLDATTLKVSVRSISSSSAPSSAQTCSSAPAPCSRPIVVKTFSKSVRGSVPTSCSSAASGLQQAP
mmetsp:Transcript_34845/g.109427  ORF Transcript_34845/g.109427 Transcript_34845/m.109427 type:complete len:203 (+) Transcript_34845:199-807(+)